MQRMKQTDQDVRKLYRFFFCESKSLFLPSKFMPGVSAVNFFNSKQQELLSILCRIQKAKFAFVSSSCSGVKYFIRVTSTKQGAIFIKLIALRQEKPLPSSLQLLSNLPRNSNRAWKCHRTQSISHAAAGRFKYNLIKPMWDGALCTCLTVPWTLKSMRLQFHKTTKNYHRGLACVFK